MRPVVCQRGFTNPAGTADSLLHYIAMKFGHVRAKTLARTRGALFADRVDENVLVFNEQVFFAVALCVKVGPSNL